MLKWFAVNLMVCKNEFGLLKPTFRQKGFQYNVELMRMNLV